MRFHSPRALGRTPRVSVVIPCYNYGRYLPAAVASALDQQGLDVDVLVVDDASPDGSHLVAQELAASDPRVDVLVHENNAGHIQTYNDGLARAEGDYVVLLSADDLLPTLRRALDCEGPSVVDLPIDYSENVRLTERLGALSRS